MPWVWILLYVIVSPIILKISLYFRIIKPTLNRNYDKKDIFFGLLLWPFLAIILLCKLFGFIINYLIDKIIINLLKVVKRRRKNNSTEMTKEEFERSFHGK
jgi:hypothetical protein